MQSSSTNTEDIQTLNESGQKRGKVLMSVKDLHKSFGGQTVLEGVDLELREGEVILLRGENGSGKTTLLNVLTGFLEPDYGEIQLFVNSHPELFRFPRRWWQELNPWDHFTPERVAVEGVGRTWQDVRLFGSQTLLDNLAVARPDQPGEVPWQILAQPLTWGKAETKNIQDVRGLLGALGLNHRCHSSADKISLGQSKRIAFARCAHANAKILFLDEPLAGLDQEGTESVIAVLRELAEAHRLTLVIVEHVFNIPIILDFATTVWTLEDGRLKEENLTVAKSNSAIQTIDTLSSLIQEMAKPITSITMEPLPRGASLTRVIKQDVLRDPILTIKDLIAYRGHRLVVGEECEGVLTGFNLTMHKGEMLFLQAPNGWGKTSLFEALSGILPCQNGKIQLDGTLLNGKPAWTRRTLGLSAVPARENAFNSLSVREFQRFSGALLKTTEDQHESSLPPDRLVSSLSGGERKHLVLETANHQTARVRIWDEPFSSLDAAAVRSIWHLLVPDDNSAAIILMPSTHTLKKSL